MEDTKGPSGVERAVAAVGGQRQLGELCGVGQQAVSKWLARGYVPTIRVVEIEAQTGIPRKELINPRLIQLVEE